MKRTPLNRVSPGYSKELHRFYSKTKPEWLAGHPGCQFVIYDWENDGTGRTGKILCGKTDGVTIHHKMRRKKYLNDKRYLMTVCIEHHSFIESHKTEARKLGYILYK